MATRFKTLKEFLYPDNGKNTFVIPNYQRGYKWSVKIDDKDTSVEYLTKSLLSAYNFRKEQQFFLQGVTVVEDDNNIILIDGQQRTTTLYLLLWCLDRKNITGNRDIVLDYSIRKKSKDYLANLKKESFNYLSEDPENLNQDIYYFKRAIEQINNILSEIKDKDDFANFLFEKISLLYIVVNAEKAVRTFTMMNGQKARMHDEELVKAEMLHIISQPEKDINLQAKTLEDTFSALKEVASIEWETNALRSKYAREWDKWLYWWNAKEVKDYFNTQKPMGLLLEYYYRIRANESTFSFRNFKSLLPDTKQAKDVFKGLRDLQKQFEDVYNNPLLHNYLKCALIGATGDADDKFDVIMYFIENKRNYNLLNEYMKWRLIGSTHKEMIEDYTIELTAEDGRRDNKEKRKERALGMIKNLSKSHVYKVYDDLLYKQLLRLNVEEYNKLKDGKGVKFDFSIWNNKSLEHIYPKTKFYHIETKEDGQQVYVRGDGEIISQEETTNLLDSAQKFSDTKKFSEHCIGNLVLLYGRNNSEFGNLPFDEKKKKFFNNERRFESRNLLHTISSFANSKWEPSDIETASRNLIGRLAMDYHIDIKNIEEK